MKVPFHKELRKALQQGKNGNLDRSHLLDMRRKSSTVKIGTKTFRVVKAGSMRKIVASEKK